MAMNRGAFDFLTKPIDFSDLDTTIAKTLRHLSTLREARQRQVKAERAHASLSRYFSPRLAERLAEGGDAPDLASERREVATLFTDVAGFTTLAESTPPSLLSSLINEYLVGMTAIVFAHDGTVAKIIGMRCTCSSARLPNSRTMRGDRSPARSTSTPSRRVFGEMGFERRPGRRDTDRRSCRPGGRRQFRRRALLRLHGLWRHDQHTAARLEKANKDSGRASA